MARFCGRRETKTNAEQEARVCRRSGVRDEKLDTEAVPLKRIKTDTVRIQANEEPSKYPGVLAVARECVKWVWVNYYIDVQAVSDTVGSWSAFSDQIDHFVVSPPLMSISVHFKPMSAMRRVCVSPQPSKRVLSRGGMHRSNGHVARFGFLFRTAFCVVCCFDSDCQKVHGTTGRVVGVMPDGIVEAAKKELRAL